MAAELPLLSEEEEVVEDDVLDVVTRPLDAAGRVVRTADVVLRSGWVR